MASFVSPVTLSYSGSYHEYLKFCDNDMSDQSMLDGLGRLATNIESSGSDLSELKVETPGNPPKELQTLDWDGPDDPGNPLNVRAISALTFSRCNLNTNEWSPVVNSKESSPHLCCEHFRNGRVGHAAPLWYLLYAYTNVCDQQDCRCLFV